MFQTAQEVKVFADVLAQALGAAFGVPQIDVGYGLKAPATTPSGNLIHGPGGLFGSVASDERVISGRVAPLGISSYLSAAPSVYTHPVFNYITGIEESGDEPSVECADCPTTVIEGCTQVAPFGYLCRETKTLTPNRVIERINQGEVDLRLVNDILGTQPGELFAAVRSYNMNTVLQVATALAMLEIAAVAQLRLMEMVWQGNPANNIGTGYAEFPGLDILISRNKVDASTGVNCEALYSDVKDFNYQLVNVQDANGNFRIVRQLRAMEAYLQHNAVRMGFMPVKWVFVMRPEMWQELSNIWPLAEWFTRNVSMTGGRQLQLDAARVDDAVRAMRNGMNLPINGRTHDVVVDDGIFESTNANDANVPAGSFASSIYMVPVTVRGGQLRATRFEHKDYKQAAPEINMAHLQDFVWSDDGRFLWTVERVKWCYTLSLKIEPRIILQVPQLAGRLDHVMITPEQHFRSPFQESDYFMKGGVEERAAPSFWADWNLPAGHTP
jgi:hypothetical protein